ncbi:MAG: ABC transporter ATP-binding protein [Pseudomonadota bacterium]|nr:ABC transporter ATP-binding protein [Pseudomonadota bacterium]
MGATITLDFITHRFRAGGAPTLENIDNRIEAGERVALIGRSGCGKSTLLHMLAGLLLPSEGCVRVNSHQVTKPSAKWNMMFQKPSLYPWMSVQENAALGLLFAGQPKQEASARVSELLDKVGLHDKKDVNVQSLSGGQQQRVALARSLATDPEVLLLDEPFSALDAFTRSALQEDVPAICGARGITMVIVTHDIDEAITMADRVLIMSQNPGRIVSELKVDLPWPRNSSSQEFQTLRNELMQRFRDTDDGLSGRKSQPEPAVRRVV